MKPAEKDPVPPVCPGNKATGTGARGAFEAVEMGVMGQSIEPWTANRMGKPWGAGLLAAVSLAGVALAGTALAGTSAPVAGTGLDVNLYGKTFSLDAGQLKEGELRRFESGGHRLELKRSGERLQLTLDGKAVQPASPESALKVNQPLMQCQILVPPDAPATFTSTSASTAGQGTARLTSDLSFSASPVKAGGKSPVGASKSPEPLLKVPAKEAAGGCEDVPETEEECGSDTSAQLPTPRTGVGLSVSLDPRVRITCVRRDGPAL